ncbi:glutamine synthetase type III [Clostridium sp. AM29-11AC]|uniref:glutamine synthetase III family protein n=1 Tax=Clostridium sp. AM29-11AC TaxID=2293028 RepID=UPI000E5499C3|nr:glutamine synthetase III [Clostridium sp. AM29-11AC]RHT55518.1 glutamine synthetase type III [Clostridium sp. AM29-11AC]
MKKPDAIFGSMVFGESAMRERLPKDVYRQLLRTIHDGRSLDPQIADTVANAMKDWALDHGATHFTHWFQPMTGITAEKHDSFITPAGDGKIIMDFSGKELIKGEPDASSFPNGGLRATFEARGYTAWDPTSYAFIKDRVLCIPTAFCSYGGEALDKKTPLLRSMEALSRQAVRILRLFGNDRVSWVRPTIGAEQEYFLIDEEVFLKRKDLILTGRTLFGATSPKGQELDDHYFGAVKPRVQAFMDELNKELWKLGILAKTEHNEVAPAQHELAPVFITANVAMDQNQLTMEMMQKIARRHHMVCLLHEKPFEGINGSGKHDNWSLCDSLGNNLLEPGNTPGSNLQFLLFLCAVIKAVDEYQDLLRLSVASAGNDHRLGANEAPPAVVSIFIGSALEKVLDSIERDCPYDGCSEREFMRGAHVLPRFPRDTTDRNRTSPFAFTGNKFEFRMPGSSSSLSGPNIMLNTAVAEELRQFADILEPAGDFKAALRTLLKKTISEHKRIIFNGNGYDESWIAEARARGLMNLKTTPDAVSHFTDEKNLALFSRHRVFSEAEAKARCEIMFENYVKVLNIEALTMNEMVLRDILPAVSRFFGELAAAAHRKAQLSSQAPSGYEFTVAAQLSSLADQAFEEVEELKKRLGEAKEKAKLCEQAFFYRDSIVPAMEALRSTVDRMEGMTDSSAWPYPSYSDIIFSVK